MEINRDNLLSLIKGGIKREGLSMSGLENLAKVPRDTIRDFMRGKTQILRADKLQKILNVLEPHHKVHITGIVRSGGEITSLSRDAKNIETDCPPGFDTFDVTAVKIEGNGMLPVFHDGWIIYYSRKPDLTIPAISGGWQVPYAKAGSKPFAEFIGKPCIVGLADGRILLGTLKRSSSKNGYDLVNYNDKDIRNIRPVWAAKIIFIKTS